MLSLTKKNVIIVFAIIVIVPILIFLLIDRDISRDVLKARYTVPASKFVDIDGVTVHYSDQGSGPVVICLHGIFASLHTWEGWVKELSGKYRIITIDVPPFGLTGRANFEYTKENYLAFLDKFITKLGLKKVNLAGNSFGGYLAWGYAAHHPERVNKLIIIDAAGYRQDLPFPVMIFTTPFFGYFTRWIMPRFMVAFNVRDVYGDVDMIKPGTTDLYYELMMNPGNREGCRELFFLLKKLMSADPVNLDKITAPTLIMWGAKDRWIPLKFAWRFNKDIKNSRIKIYDKAGHIPMEEMPTETARDAGAFLD